MSSPVPSRCARRGVLREWESMTAKLVLGLVVANVSASCYVPQGRRAVQREVFIQNKIDDGMLLCGRGRHRAAGGKRAGVAGSTRSVALCRIALHEVCTRISQRLRAALGRSSTIVLLCLSRTGSLACTGNRIGLGSVAVSCRSATQPPSRGGEELATGCHPSRVGTVGLGLRLPVGGSGVFSRTASLREPCQCVLRAKERQ